MLVLQVYEITRDGESNQEDFLTKRDENLKSRLIALLRHNNVDSKDLVTPEPVNDRDELMVIDGHKVMKSMKYHQRTAGVMITFTAQTRTSTWPYRDLPCDSQ